MHTPERERSWKTIPIIGAAMDQPMSKHIRIVSTILVVLGVLYLLAAGFAGVFGLLALNNQAEPADMAWLPALFTGGIILLPLIAIGVVHIATASAFRQGKSWSRIALWILSILNLGNVPIGTVFGGYAIWVLVRTNE